MVGFDPTYPVMKLMNFVGIIAEECESEEGPIQSSSVKLINSSSYIEKRPGCTGTLFLWISSYR